MLVIHFDQCFQFLGRFLCFFEMLGAKVQFIDEQFIFRIQPVRPVCSLDAKLRILVSILARFGNSFVDDLFLIFGHNYVYNKNMI